MGLLTKESDLEKASKRLSKTLSENANQQPELRLRLLMNLYNTFPPASASEFRYTVFKNIIDYAHRASLFDQVFPYLEYLDTWKGDWSKCMSAEDERALYLDLSRYLRVFGKRVESFQHSKTYHKLFEGASATELGAEGVQQSTILFLRDAISIPSVIQFDDVLEFATVKVAAKSKSASGLVDLCKIFLSGNVDDLRKFHAKNAALFKEHELEIEDAMAKIRLLSLATLAYKRCELTLSEVAKALEEEEDAVEKWVVRAISEGLIDGRIDQLNHKVLVKSSFQRQFREDEWSFLDGKLSQWIGNLENVIKFIGEQKSLRDTAVVGGTNGVTA